MSNSEEIRHRAGRYVHQPHGGYRAFIPNPLPPVPQMRIEGAMQKQLGEADRSLGRLDGSVLTLPNPDFFVYLFVRKEAVLSSQIEGTQSSLQDLLRAEAHMLDPRGPSDVVDVINYIAAMNHGLERLATLPVSVRLIREIHERLLDGVRGGRLQRGELRTSQNWIGAAGSTPDTAVFVPPPAEVVPELLSDLERFLHADDDMHILVRIGLAHAQFETIHPFLDGNGRVGRLLIAFLLAERGVLHKPVLYLSHYFKKHRKEYYDRLQSVRDDGDWEGWLLFFLNGVAEVSEQAADTARRILLLREQHREHIIANLGRASGSGIRLLESLYRHPIISGMDASRASGLSKASASRLVARFVELGILVEITGHSRNRRFMYDDYVALFREEDDRPR